MATQPGFLIKTIDQAIYDATHSVWTTQLQENEAEVPSSAYRRILEWAKRHVNGQQDKNTYCYVLSQEDKPYVACALLEISHARPQSDGPWLKVLQIHVQPKWEVSTLDEETMPLEELARLAASALVEAFGLTFEELPSCQLKVWCSTPLTKEFMQGIVLSLPATMGIKVATHGNWLVLEKKAA
ncbi:hypothetical protein [Acidihalobacter prosperus]|uniref:hypothetical protein n=1 Tax=Acidihalobacter prosperus TaxID=160660 RepID=UPI0005028987|nr:hypothetical protein [Acidihalobacter prosperus]